MAILKVEYEMTVARPFVEIVSVVFNNQRAADLARDEVTTGTVPPHYKSNPNTIEDQYFVVPDNEKVEILAVAKGNDGFKFSMTVTFTVVDQNFETLVPPFTPKLPKLEATVRNGIGIIDTEIPWR